EPPAPCARVLRQPLEPKPPVSGGAFCVSGVSSALPRRALPRLVDAVAQLVGQLGQLPPLLGQPAVLAGGLLAFVAGVALQRLTEHGVGIQVQAAPDAVLVLPGWFVLAQRADRRLTHAGRSEERRVGE